jgi:hypothetical protein
MEDHAQPTTDVHWPVAAGPAPPARALVLPILVGLSSSQRRREERLDVEAQHQEDARTICHHARVGADPAWASYSFGGSCLAFTDALRRVSWPRKFCPNITFKYDGSTDPRESCRSTPRPWRSERGRPPCDAKLVLAGAQCAASDCCFAFLGAPCACGKIYASSLLMRSRAGTSAREPLTTCWRYLNISERHCTT